MVGILMAGPVVNTLASTVTIVLFGNLAAAATYSGLYVLDAQADQQSSGIRNLTPAGCCLVAVTFNVMAGVAIGTPAEYAAPFSSPRTAALIIGLPVFLAGWFLLSRFGFRVWKTN
ncbi:hypothetical protein [Rosistilla ulvae]|uniref:hypothetical protein n=1 Tax=Rosistilla ulvae TaxID=1930277 RepID=UPI0011A898EB|nr:hypothetical protein [Rosistilla ulvae]